MRAFIFSLSVSSRTGINFDLKAIILKVFSTLGWHARAAKRERRAFAFCNHDNYGASDPFPTIYAYHAVLLLVACIHAERRIPMHVNYNGARLSQIEFVECARGSTLLNYIIQFAYLCALRERGAFSPFHCDHSLATRTNHNCIIYRSTGLIYDGRPVVLTRDLTHIDKRSKTILL